MTDGLVGFGVHDFRPTFLAKGIEQSVKNGQSGLGANLAGVLLFQGGQDFSVETPFVKVRERSDLGVKIRWKRQDMQLLAAPSDHAIPMTLEGDATL